MSSGAREWRGANEHRGEGTRPRQTTKAKEAYANEHGRGGTGTEGGGAGEHRKGKRTDGTARREGRT